jgi:hypothetical protein
MAKMMSMTSGGRAQQPLSFISAPKSNQFVSVVKPNQTVLIARSSTIFNQIKVEPVQNPNHCNRFSSKLLAV